MKRQLNNRTIVIGAGAGGITSALLAAKRGERVSLLEAHSALGGCASWFRRGPFIFDAGATTLSGLEQGQPLNELFNLMGKRPELQPCDPGIVFHLSCGKIIRYYRDFERWMLELAFHFPHHNHRPFWELVRNTSRRGWAVLNDMKRFPFRELKDILGLISHPEHLVLFPALVVSTEHMIKYYQLDQADYLELINGIMLISAQAHSEQVPFMVGAMALSYPAQTYAPLGGMKGLMDFFESELLELGVEIRKKTRVKSFSADEIVLEQGEIIRPDRMIVNLPVWNMAQMTQGRLKEQLSEEASAHPGGWGAFTLYFAVKSAIKELYHQVHINHQLVKNYFVSFSVLDDSLRAPPGYQCVTISTHVNAEAEIDKNELTQIVLKDFMGRFPCEDFKFITAGTPATFERYTGRMKGFVGGLPFQYGSNPQNMLGNETMEKEIFRVGDTVFPGQGFAAVVAGAIGLHHRLI